MRHQGFHIFGEPIGEQSKLPHHLDEGREAAAKQDSDRRGSKFDPDIQPAEGRLWDVPVLRDGGRRKSGHWNRSASLF